jgi:hypothetical protein
LVEGNYLAINHEPKDILNAIEGTNSLFVRIPHPFPIRTSLLDCTADFGNVLGIGYGDFDVGILLVAAEIV